MHQLTDCLQDLVPFVRLKVFAEISLDIVFFLVFFKLTEKLLILIFVVEA